MMPFQVVRYVLSAFLLAPTAFAGVDPSHLSQPLGSPAKSDISLTPHLLPYSVEPPTFQKRNHTNATALASVRSSFLVLALASSSQAELDSAKSGLNDYGIPFELFLVPNGNVTLPPLNSSSTSGNYGGIVVFSELSYSYLDANNASAWTSALSLAQWNALYQYQVAFGVRMVRLAGFPNNSPGEQDSGTSSLGGCCDLNVENFLSINDTSEFATAGLVQGAKLSGMNLWHNPAVITNSSIATAFASFLPNSNFPTSTVAAVINNFPSGRQQMVFFITFGTDWSLTSNLLTHAWIHWATRGLYAGYRRAMLNTQVDDMFLTTKLNSSSDPTGNYRVIPNDLELHIPWMASINSRLPPGSNYTIEIGHNGNGNIGVCPCCVLPCLNETVPQPQHIPSLSISSNTPITSNTNTSPNRPVFDRQAKKDDDCKPGAIDYHSLPDTPLEFSKVPGTGADLWPSSTSPTYPYNASCLSSDVLGQFFQNTTLRDAFLHVSHTFTHEEQNNATYHDVYREITWNQAWAKQIGLVNARGWSGRGIIPPAITGLHNGDALRAWAENGIVNVVGDNTRPVLRNQINDHWPLNTTVKENGRDGIQITPRWSTRIYYNCDLVDCDVQQWLMIANISSGNISTLLELEKASNVHNLVTLHHDAFMFHQANMRKFGVNNTVVNGTPGNFSLLQMWVETIVTEYARVVTWPLITLKHDDLAFEFKQRMTRDLCNYTMSYNVDFPSKTITGLTVTAPNNVCAAPIPVTVSGSVKDTLGFKSEQIGSDPLTVWVALNGSPVTLELDKPIPW